MGFCSAFASVLFFSSTTVIANVSGELLFVFSAIDTIDEARVKLVKDSERIIIRFEPNYFLPLFRNIVPDILPSQFCWFYFTCASFTSHD